MRFSRRDAVREPTLGVNTNGRRGGLWMRCGIAIGIKRGLLLGTTGSLDAVPTFNHVGFETDGTRTTM